MMSVWVPRHRQFTPRDHELVEEERKAGVEQQFNTAYMIEFILPHKMLRATAPYVSKSVLRQRAAMAQLNPQVTVGNKRLRS